VENIHTLMLFISGQTQAVVLQYKTPMQANDAHDAAVGKAERVTICDDYGRRLTVRPTDVQMALVQDIDLATDGNVASMVKNNLVQALTQMRTQNEMDADPKVKAAVVRSQLQQGAGGGAFRQ
jgi:hypothetical protein